MRVHVRFYLVGRDSGIATLSRVPMVGEEIRVMGFRYTVRGVRHLARVEGEVAPDVDAEIGLSYDIAADPVDMGTRGERYARTADPSPTGTTATATTSANAEDSR